jgi:hypothetical protein
MPPRLDRYADYEQMDLYPEIQSVLGGYAEEAADLSDFIWVPSVIERLGALVDPELRKQIEHHDAMRKRLREAVVIPEFFSKVTLANL